MPEDSDLADPRSPRAVVAQTLYEGAERAPRRDCLVEISAGRIAEVRPVAAADARRRDVREVALLAPGFIDLQINGAAGRLFNATPDVETLAAMAAGARVGGTAHILPTFITAPGAAYRAALAAVEAAQGAGVTGILGLHLEGPFLSAEKPGIHDPAAIRAMTPGDLDRLVEVPPRLPLLLTVAPECLPAGALARLTASGVVVFAGHSAASADRIAAAEADGLRGATHLFNAMTQLSARAPGVAGAVMASERLFAGIIADGHHVDWRTLIVAMRAMPGRLFLVTDAMPTLAGCAASFDLNGRRITLSGGRLQDAAGRLAGAHLDMAGAVRNLVTQADVPISRALDMASGIPAAALGMSADLGRIRPGFRASFTALDAALQPTAVFVDGRAFGPDTP
jgi:N-acetylglucosamine-6-phosphate deacetylase